MKKAVIKALEIVGTMLILFGLSIDDRASTSPDTAFTATLILLALGAGCIWLTTKIKRLEVRQCLKQERTPDIQ
jgi:hypothetical protein